MIVIEPDAATALNRSGHRSSPGALGAALKMRELRSFLSKAKSAVGLRGDISVLLATDTTIRTLNRDFRKKDKTTDVLSFPAVDDHPGKGRKLAGDMAVSLETAARQAEEHGHTLQVEVKILLLHGLLHLAGYDHETDTGQMARKESALRKQFDLPAGLIQRSSKSKKSVRTTQKKSASARSQSRSRMR
jgi:probable rRNA maturation factor